MAGYRLMYVVVKKKQVALNWDGPADVWYEYQIVERSPWNVAGRSLPKWLCIL